MGSRPDPAGDHGYDLVHQDLDATAQQPAPADDAHRAAPPPSDRDPSGDYGYDEAHGF
jgi:hypothetical protein